MLAPGPWLYLDADGFFASCEEAADRRLHGRPVANAKLYTMAAPSITNEKSRELEQRPITTRKTREVRMLPRQIRPPGPTLAREPCKKRCGTARDDRVAQELRLLPSEREAQAVRKVLRRLGKMRMPRYGGGGHRIVVALVLAPAAA